MLREADLVESVESQESMLEWEDEKFTIFSLELERSLIDEETSVGAILFLLFLFWLSSLHEPRTEAPRPDLTAKELEVSGDEVAA